MAAITSLAAELRYRIDAFGQQLVGAGSYLQAVVDGDRLLKLELQTRVGNRPATLIEVRGRSKLDEASDFYWVRRDVPPEPPKVWRVNLRDLRSAEMTPPEPSSPPGALAGVSSMLGGLPQLLASLDQNFAFDAPTADELQFRGADGQAKAVPVWKLTGRWKSERLSALTGRDAAKSSEIPEQLPQRVELILNRSQAIPPLFPCRITFWRAAGKKGKQPAAGSGQRELLTLEFFHIDPQAKIELAQFSFNAGDADVENRTERYKQRFSGGTVLR